MVITGRLIPRASYYSIRGCGKRRTGAAWRVSGPSLLLRSEPAVDHPKFYRIRHARTKYVGKYQACMVITGRLIPRASYYSIRGCGNRRTGAAWRVSGPSLLLRSEPAVDHPK